MKRFIYLFSIGVFALTAICGCEKAVIDNGSSDKPLDAGAGPAVSFAGEIIPIFSAKCVACHGTGGQTPVLEASVAYSDLTSGGFVIAGSPTTSPLYIQITTVHSGKMTAPEEEKVYNWIAQGALNN